LQKIRTTFRRDHFHEQQRRQVPASAEDQIIPSRFRICAELRRFPAQTNPGENRRVIFRNTFSVGEESRTGSLRRALEPLSRLLRRNYPARFGLTGRIRSKRRSEQIEPHGFRWRTIAKSRFIFSATLRASSARFVDRFRTALNNGLVLMRFGVVPIFETQQVFPKVMGNVHPNSRSAI
jgi:hypothetical protein